MGTAEYKQKLRSRDSADEGRVYRSNEDWGLIDYQDFEDDPDKKEYAEVRGIKYTITTLFLKFDENSLIAAL